MPGAGMRVLIAGIGGASLGTEILKCLVLAGQYRIFGSDISPLAFGHGCDTFERTYIVDRSNYVSDTLRICREQKIDCIIPGGEQPLRILAEAAGELAAEGIHLATNSPEVVRLFTDKRTTFEFLGRIGIATPRTIWSTNADDLDVMNFPCVVKPATGSGGSSFVFLANDRKEARLYLEYLLNNGQEALLQEYIPEDEGEFTIGVLSLPNRQLVGSVALKRVLTAKLSVQFRGERGVISSGYSQGLIEEFPEYCKVAERIAREVGSEGPMNVQGRVRGGVFLPFEINPRFSASTYLRALAGFNEIHRYLQYVRSGVVDVGRALRPGYYLRSLTEAYVPGGTAQ